MNDLEKKFAEVEKRVRALTAENRMLNARVSELDRELIQARRVAQNLEQFHGKKMHLREKIERILQSLEAVGDKDV